ncbi:MAG: hypothetical protein D6704_00305, partial [Nitrospirae bacterium]
MITRCYTVQFFTPAFLGDAEQNGRWRTPPFKALLRQWWRVVYAADHGFNVDVETMRREEGLLFGNAWLSHQENGREVTDHCKSLVRLRLDRWQPGNLKSWNGLEQSSVTHPEVQKTNYKVGPHAYLGYGPLDGRGGTKLNEKVKVVVNAGECATLSIAVPNEHASRIERALWLMDRYGTIGGRSRNGWGSFAVLPLPLGEGWGEGRSPASTVPLRKWQGCLDCDWPHAIGQDDQGPLIWQTTKAYDDWKALMRELAIIKIGLRTQFVFPNAQLPHSMPLPRHWLSYPITTHKVRDWEKQNLRLPNILRFKIRSDTADPKKLRGVIFHMPCLLPPEFSPDPSAIEATWLTVHTLLDELCKPSNNRTYS